MQEFAVRVDQGAINALLQFIATDAEVKQYDVSLQPLKYVLTINVHWNLEEKHSCGTKNHQVYK